MYNNTQTSILSLAGQSSSEVSPLEQEVLDEYERLSGNMKEVGHPVSPTLVNRSEGRGARSAKPEA